VQNRRKKRPEGAESTEKVPRGGETDRTVHPVRKRPENRPDRPSGAEKTRKRAFRRRSPLGTGGGGGRFTLYVHRDALGGVPNPTIRDRVEPADLGKPRGTKRAVSPERGHLKHGPTLRPKGKKDEPAFPTGTTGEGRGTVPTRAPRENRPEDRPRNPERASGEIHRTGAMKTTKKP
jgi:hypothetical protein